MAQTPPVTSPFDDPNLELIPAKEAKAIIAPKPVATPMVRGLQPSRDDVVKRAAELGVDPNLALSIWSQESGQNANSRDSSKGAKGGFQVMSPTYRQMMGTNDGERDPFNNMEAGLRYLKHGQSVLKTNDPQLLAAGYHAGYNRDSLKTGQLPGADVNDGSITSADYARSVSARMTGTKSTPAKVQTASALDTLNKAEPGRYEAIDPLQEELNAQEPGRYEAFSPDEAIKFDTDSKAQAAIDNKPLGSYLKDKTVGGFDNMAQSLSMARWAVAGGDAKALAEQLAKQYADQAATPKSTGEKEMDAGFQAVSDAKGAKDTAVAGVKALWTAATNPKALAGEVVGQAANSLPTLATGAVGAGTGAGIGALAGAPAGGIGAIPGAIAGAIIGGKSGMAIGTTATELGSEVSEMVQNRLQKENQAPTAQNILAILSDKQFQKDALIQGAKKGLTVAAIDQAFMGLGGKIASAPARKLATQELADAGVDVSTAAARKAALASPAGRAALEAAKPSVAARAGSYTAATAVDSAGEVLGEGVSQQVARGEVDYGDALREGVASLGQSVVEPAIGGAMETGKRAIAAARAPIQPTQNAPSTAAGPLQRAAENASAQPDRVTATAPDGSKVTGTVTGTSEDGQVQIVDDNGEIVTFQTGPNGVKIEQEAPNSPLSNALEVAADSQPEAQAPNTEVAAPNIQDEAANIDPVSQPETETAPQAAPVLAEAITEQPAAPAAEAPAPPALSEMDEPALRTRLKYLADQAKSNGGWDKMLVAERRKVEKEINARAKAAQPALDLNTETKQPKGTPDVTQANQAVEAKTQQPAEAEKVAPAPAAIAQPAIETVANAKALDRIARGTAYFGSKPKAAEWIKTNDLGATHEVVKGDGGEWNIVAKAGNGAKAPVEPAQNAPQAEWDAYEAAMNAMPDVENTTQGKSIERQKAERAAEKQALNDSIPASAKRGIDQRGWENWAKASGRYVDGSFASPEQRDDAKALTAFENKATKEQKKRILQLINEAETKAEKEAINGSDNNPAGKPASAEEVAEKADAVSAPAATVQPEAAKEVGRTVESVAKAIQLKVASNRRKYQEKSRKEREAKGWSSNSTPESERAGYESEANAEPSELLQRSASALLGDNPLPLIEMFVHGNFEASEDVFKEITGVRIRGLSVAGKKAALYKWANWTPEQIAKAEQNASDKGAERAEKFKQDDLKDAVRGAWLALDDLKVKTGDADVTGQEYVTQTVASGFDRAHKQKKGVATIYGLTDGKGFITLKSKPFTEFVRAALAFGGLDKAMQYVNPPKPQAPAGFVDRSIDTKNTPEVNTSAEPVQKSEKTEQVASPLVQAMNFLMELEAKAAQQGRIVDDRLLTMINQQKAVVQELQTDPTPPTGGGAPSPFANNKLFTQSAVDKARARLKSKLTQINSGFDPEMAMDGLTLAGAYVESGVRTFSAYSKAMIEDIGEGVKPYLLSFYESVRHYPGVDGDGMSSSKSAQAQHEAMMLDHAEVEKAKSTPRVGTQENDNEPTKLDQPSPRELEGQQPDLLQGTEPSGQAGIGSEGSGGADALGNDGTGGQRAQQPGGVGNDTREVPVPASRAPAGRGGKSGGEPVQRGKRAAKPDTVQRDAGNQPSLIPESGTRAQDRADGFVITEDDAIGEGGAKTKFKQNIAAIRLLKELTAANRQATRTEQAVLAKYVGWGGIPQAFYRDNNEVSKGWEKEAAELKGVLTEVELAAAAASTRNAHYTSPEIVTGMWDALKHFGFQGGRTLESALGVGNFYGLMPTALRSASQLTGVELDHITGGIAKQLYPQANIQAPMGFQDFTAPDGYFDLAVGNPPFGAEGIYDPRNRKISGFSIHNYFFAKSIDAVKPNGVLAMVVTNRLLDKVGDKERSYIAQRSEFLGAIRLPNNAFSKNAGTEVTTDIIFLRKLKDGEQPTGHKWTEVKQYKDASGKFVPLNEYFVANPDMMLGDFGMYGSMYSPEDSALVARPGQDTPALMQAAIAKLPAGFMDAPTAAPALETIEPKGDIARVKIGSVFEQGGQIYERREDMLGKQQAAPVVFASDKAKERVTGMIQVRDALIDVRGLQLQENVNEKELETARAALNKSYDTFVKANGPLNADANKRLMRDDPTWPQIAALEDNFDKGVSPAVAKNTGEKARAPSAHKSAIFSKRTQSPYKAPETAESAKDAMVSSMSERGRVDLDYMASLYEGHTPEQIAKELDGLIFKNPAGGWESRDQYLSGNVKKKLAQAIDAAQTDMAMKANVEALNAVQPADIEAVDIDVKTGSHWVPADVMQNFIQTLSGGERAKAIYNPITATWTLSVERATAANVTEYSTDRVTMTAVLEAAANQKQIVVRDKHYDGTTTVNEASTTAANAKVEKVKAEWKNWIWTDDARRDRLARIYNDTFNTDVQREFDGSHLTFPGKVGDDIIQLRPHQGNAVWRAVQSDTTLLDHVVGAGKTFTMVAIMMEMRRMGLAKKPMLAVPNHLVGQWAEDFMKLYPGANILAATKKDFEKENRKKLFARIATGDWDAVIVAHSSFGKVEVEPEFQSAFIKQQIADMDTSISAMRAAEGKGSRNVKQIEKQKANLEEKLKKLFDTGGKDDNLYFSELGVDALLLDEAHEFKNLGFSTGMQRVAGLGNPSGSNKAADMFMKIQATLQRTGGKNIVFATGTPISNTMAEMYTMQRFLDYGTLKDQGISHFDAWAKTFGEVVTDWELSPSGQYKMNSRFAKFVNMPELMQRYASFADVVNRDDINRMLAVQGKKLPVPKIEGGKPENTVVERSNDQAQYIGVPTVDENGVEAYPEHSLIYRSENLPKKAQKGSDNMLKIMSDARKAALDMRLIDPSYGDNPASKVNVAVGNIKSIYDKWTAKKGVQLVFCDLSTPKAAVAKEAAALRALVALAEDGDQAAQEKLDAMSPDELLALDSKFSVYDDLKAKLIASGIPENEIAFIHDASTELQKQELFAKVKAGRIRVLMGSTAKMGAGMNVQDRLVALHHMDAPWRPSDLEQREGRIIRQGNLFEPMTKSPEAVPGFEIRILRYATKQTLDSRMWQTIEAKARFIEQVRKGTGSREVEDVAGEAANSAEMKAASSGNPLILEEMSLRQGIRKLENQKSEHDREQYRIKDRIRWAQDYAAKNDKQAADFEADAPLAPKEFVVKIGNQSFDKHGEAGQAILDAVNAMYDAGKDSREIGSYGGFKLTVDDTSTSLLEKRAVLTIEGKGSYQTEANPGSAATGLALRLQNTVKTLKTDAEQTRAAAARERAEVPKLQEKVKPWGGAAELATSKTQHGDIIEQLKPKKKPEAVKPEDGDAAFAENGEIFTEDLLRIATKESSAATGWLAHALETDVQGVIPGKDRELDRQLNKGNLSEDEIRAHFSGTIAAIRAQQGDMVTLWRADAPEGSKSPTARTVFMASKDVAEKYANNGRMARPYTVKVDSILGVYARSSGYYEVIVSKDGNDAAFAAPAGWGKIEGNERETLTVITDAQAREDIALLEKRIDTARDGMRAAAEHPYRAVRLRDADALSAIGNAFGVRVVGFDVNPDLLGSQKYNFFSGVTFKKTNKSVYLNADTNRPHMAILGHETAHQLAARRPDIYAALVEAIRPYIDQKKYGTEFANSAVAKNVESESGKREEFIGEVMSDAFMDPLFWNTLGKDSPTLLKQVYNFVVSILRKVAAAGGYTKQAAPYLTDYDRVIQIAAGAMAEFGMNPGEVAKKSLFGFTFAEKANAVGNQGGRSADDTTPGGSIELFHASPEKGLAGVDDRRGLFGGVFASASERSAASHGDNVYKASLPKESVLSQHDLDYEIANEKVEAALRKAMPGLSPEDYETAYKFVIDDQSHKVDAEDLMRIFRSDSVGEASWDAQRVRGKVAKALGYKAVEMSDEHGTSYLLLPGVKFNPNESTAPDISFAEKDAAFAEKPVVKDSLTPPEQGMLRKVQAVIQDNMNRVRQVQERIEKMTGRKLPEHTNYYGAEANRPGRIAARMEDAKSEMTGPLMEKLAKSGHTPAQLGELLHAMHAPERNERIAKINPEMPDGGSGMTNAEAAAVLAKYAGNAKLHALANDARAIAKATLETKLAYGLIDIETFEALATVYQSYVPLKGDGEFGPKIKRAMGHDEREEHILENLARDYDQAVVAGERNLARQTLLQMVLTNPDSELWTVGVPPRGRFVAGKVYSVMKSGIEVATFTSESQVSAYLEAKGAQAALYEVQDSNGDRVQSFVKPLQDNEVMVYLDGRPVRIQIKDEKLAAQVRPLDQGQMHVILEGMRSINRYLSKVYTAYNPAFILRNTVRDAMTGSVNMIGNEGAMTAAKAWANYPAALKAMGQFAATHKTPTGEAGAYLDEYRMHGGKTGASWMSDLEAQGKSLQHMYDDAYGASGYLADGKPGKAALIAGRKILGGMAHVVEVANQATENGLRLALFMALRKQGVSPGLAAQAAKNTTVNFDRKGTMTPALGAIYLFINPAIQGTANAIKTLAKGQHKKQAWMALGALAALGFYAASQGMDDDKDRWLGEGWNTRSANVILNIGGRKIQIPISFEFAPFYGFGAAMAEAMRGESTMKSAVRMMSSIIDAYVPLRGVYKPDSDNHAADIIGAAIPTVLQPYHQSATNRNVFGSKIVPETDYTKDKPDNLKMNRNTKNTAYDKAAQGIASMSPSKYENDIAKISPETLKHFYRTYTGGLGTFIADSIGAASMTLEDPKQVEASDVPIVKDFIKAQDVRPIRGRFYDLAGEVRAAASEFKDAKKNGDGEAMDQILANPTKEALIGLDKLVSSTAKATAKLRDEAVEINADIRLDASAKRAALKDLEAQEQEILRAAIEAFK